MRARLVARRWAAGLWVFGLVGCRAAPEAAPTPAASSAELQAAFEGRCRADCERRRQMQAVAMEVIEAGCRADCAAAWATPWVEALASLGARLGQDVRALGRLEARPEGWVLVLRDGEVGLADAAGEGELSGHAGQRVLIWSGVQDREGRLVLEPVSLVIPEAPSER